MDLDAPLFSDEAEMSILGSMFLSKYAAEDGFNILTADDFYRPSHQTAFRAMESIHKRKGGIDLVSVIDALGEDDLKIVGGDDYLIQIGEYVPSAANSTYYATIVKDKSTLRQLDSHGKLCRELARKHAEVHEIIDEAKADFSRLSATPTVAQTARGAAQEKMDEVDSELAGIVPRGLSTGLADLDAIFAPRRAGQLNIIGARPAMGKTSAAFTIATNQAKQGHWTLFFSLEQVTSELLDRFIAMESGVSPEMRRDDPQRWYSRVADAMEIYSQLPIIIEDQSASTSDVRARARELKMAGRLDSIWVDYLTLMRDTEKSENMTLAIGQRAKALKEIAKDLQVPVYVLAQLNRGLEARTDKRPMLSDLRQSGEIEQHADSVLMLYRDSYYNPPEDGDAVACEATEVIIRKQRNGPSDKTALLGFHKDRTKFVDITRSSQEEYWAKIKGN